MPETPVSSPQPPAQRQLGADDRTQAGGLRGLVEPWRAVEAVAIEQGHGGIAEHRGAVDERLGQRRGPEEAEGGGGVEFYVHGEARNREQGTGNRNDANYDAAGRSSACTSASSNRPV